MQHNCISQFRTESKSKELNSSFICGHKVTDAHTKDILLKSGLYHLLVVSGGHFHFLEMLMIRMKWPLLAQMAALIAYFLSTGLQAPGFRAITQLAFRNAANHFNHPISQLQISLLSGLFILCIESTYWTSLSFWLSWQIGIALTLSDELSKETNSKPLLAQIIIFFSIMPATMSLGTNHPMTYLIGFILAAPSSIFLALTALISGGLGSFWLPARVWTDQLQIQFIDFLRELTNGLKLDFKNSIQLPELWVILFTTFIIFHALIQNHRRRHP